jgi:hypothetical protein
MTTSDPALILARIDQTYRALFQTLGDLSDEDLQQPGMVGSWRGVDLLAHLARWEEAGLAVIDHHLRGEPAPDDYRDYEAWNARWAAEDASLAPAAARQRWTRAHQQLLDRLRGLSPAQWDEVVRDWVEGVTAGHYEEHLADVLAWRRRISQPAEPPGTCC